jgi:hypothetical protein
MAIVASVAIIASAMIAAVGTRSAIGRMPTGEGGTTVEPASTPVKTSTTSTVPAAVLGQRSLWPKGERYKDA